MSEEDEKADQDWRHASDRMQRHGCYAIRSGSGWTVVRRDGETRAVRRGARGRTASLLCRALDDLGIPE